MSALLRSTKFFRLVPGMVRQVTPASSPSAPSPQSHGASASAPSASAGQLAHAFDTTAPFQVWSLQYLQTALPALSASADGANDDDHWKVGKDLSGRLLELEIPAAFAAPICPSEADVGEHVTREEIEALLGRIPFLELDLAEKQSVLCLRLCGRVLEQDVPDSKERTTFVNDVWTKLEEDMKVSMNVEHYNALLHVYLENDHPFCPDYVQRRLKAHRISPNHGTQEALATRYCQDGQLEEGRRLLAQMLRAGSTPSKKLVAHALGAHGQARDLKGARDVLHLMHEFKLSAGHEDYVLLLKSCAETGDMAGMADVVQMLPSEVNLNRLVFDSVLQLLMAGHKQSVTHVLALASAASVDYAAEASKCMLQTLALGHEEAAIAILCTLPGDKRVHANNLLGDLIAVPHSMEKLLGFAEELDRRNLLPKGALESLLQSALERSNLALSLALVDMQAREGKAVSPDTKRSLINLSAKSSQVLAVVQAIGQSLSVDEISTMVIPALEKSESASPNDILERIHSVLDNDDTKEKVTSAMVFRLLEKDCVEEARMIAARHKPATESEPREKVQEQCDSLAIDESPGGKSEIVEPHDIVAASAPVHPVAMVQIFDSNSNTYQYWPLPHVCEIFRSEGRFWDLEQLVLTSRNGLRPEDRKAIYLYTLQSYIDNCLYDRAVTLCKQLAEEGLDQDFPEYFALMNHFSEAFSCTTWGGSPPSYSSCSTPYPASSEESVPHLSGSDEDAPVPHYKAIKRALLNKDVDEAMSIYRKLEEKGKLLNVTESSTLVELLVKHDRALEAAAVTQRMLQRETYPMPKIFRFLLNRLAIQGEAEAMAHFEPYLTSKIKKEVSFDNRLCNAFLSAGKGKEFLSKLQKDLAAANASNIQAVKDRFPRGGAMGLLENYPHLIEEYSQLAHDFVAHGYIAPMNVLWTYYFINGKHDLAAPLWDKYVKRCPQIMFQKICQTARTQGNLELASKLVSLLHEAQVTSGAQGIAYSCLLDVQSQRGLFQEGLTTLKAGLEHGLDLDDINRTALNRLRTGVLNEGKEFDFEIPKKCKAHEERSVSPSSDIDF